MTTPSLFSKPRPATPDDVRTLATWLDQLSGLPVHAWGAPDNGTFPPEMIEFCSWVFSMDLLEFPDFHRHSPVGDLLRDPALVRWASLDDCTRAIAFIHAKERHQSVDGDGHVFHDFIRSHGLAMAAQLRQLAQAAGKGPVEDRQRGCLLGLFVGDALGAQVEFMEPWDIAERFPGGVRTMSPGGPHHLAAGQITDDGELAIAGLSAIDAWGNFNADLAARAYSDWLASRPFDIGGTIAAAITGADETRARMTAARDAQRRHDPTAPLPLVDSPAAAMRAAASQTSQANGALMRLGGLVARGFRGDVIQAAAEDARLTHPNPVCVDANRVMAAALQVAILGVNDHAGIWQAAMDAARPSDRKSADTTPLIQPLGVTDRVYQTLCQSEQAPERCHGDGAGWVLRAFQLAFWHLRQGTAFDDALIDVVGRGGDTDTNAAITGMLLGAAYGEQAIPTAWRDTVLNCQPDDSSPNPRPMRWWAATGMKELTKP